MKVLVTGGTGVVGVGAIDALLAGGHEVRVLARNAQEDTAVWGDRVEPWKGDVAELSELQGSMGGCEAVVHIAGIVSENPPETTFEAVNVQGTANVVAEAERVGVRRIIYLSSLGADTGASPYHQSKLAAENIIRSFHKQWLILRPGNVYGPGDEVISMLLQMVRAFPAVPMIGDGTQTFQPIYYKDLGKAITQAVERTELNHTVFELAGEELTTMFDVLERLSTITGQYPAKIAVPEFVAKYGTKVGEAIGVPMPVDSSKLTMLEEENYIRKPKDNALTNVFHVTPTPLQDGLLALADDMPEVLLSDGVGPLEKKLYWADITNASPSTPEELFDLFRKRFTEVMMVDIGAEPGTPSTFVEGTTLTGWLPLRGNFQIRAEQVTDRSATFVTVEGHPLAGVLHFLFEQRGTEVRFSIEIFARASNFIDLILMQTVGGIAQEFTWQSVVERVVEMSGGQAAGGVQTTHETLEGDYARNVETWVKEMVLARRKQERRERAGKVAV